MKMYFIQDGQPVEIKRAEIKSSSDLGIKLSKKQKKQLRQMREHRSGTLTLALEAVDPYKDFKDKIKEQIKRSYSEKPNI